MKYIVIFIIALCWLGTSPSHAAKRLPGQNWKQFETEHLILIFPDAAQEQAINLAQTAEKNIPDFEKLFGYIPPGKTPIVLNNSRDESNGYAQSIYRKLELYMTPSLSDDFGSGDPDWLSSLFLHEYGHLCHGMREEGVSRFVNTIFGNVHGVNYVAPRWFVEGMAIYSETLLSHGGRGRSNYHEMIWAANLLGTDPWHLGHYEQHSKFQRPWNRIYLVGYAMLDYLNEQASDELLLDRLSAKQSAWPFFGLDDVWQQVAHTSTGQVWDELVELKQKQFLSKYGAKRLPVKNGRYLATDSFSSYQTPIWIEDNKIVASKHSLELDSIRFVTIDLDTKHKKLLSEISDIYGAVGYDREKRELLVGKRNVNAIYHDARYSDLVAINRNGKQRRLTWNARIHSPACSDTGVLVAIQNKNDQSRLVIKNNETDDWKIIPVTVEGSYQHPSWSPDGRNIAAVIKYDLEKKVGVIDSKTGDVRFITEKNNANETDPCWSKDGSVLYYSADYNGVYQIYAFYLREKKCYRLTNSRFGAFDPILSPDGKTMIIREYQSGNRSQLFRFELDSADTKEVRVDATALSVTERNDVDTKLNRVQRYSPWQYLIPSLWVPYMSADEAGWMPGILSAQRDPLEQHEWWAYFYFQPVNSRWYGEFSYTNREWVSDWTTKFFKLPGIVNDEEGAQVWSVKQGVTLSNTMEWIVTRDSGIYHGIQLPVRYTFQQFKHASDLKSDTSQVLSGSIHYSFYKQAARDLFPTKGFGFSLYGKSSLDDSAYDERLVMFSTVFHLPLPVKHQTVRLGISGFKQDGKFAEFENNTRPLGYDGEAPTAGYGAVASLMHQLPLWYIDNGPQSLPLFFYDLWLEWGVDSGLVWQDNLSGKKLDNLLLSSAVMKLHLDTSLFWYLNARFDGTVMYRLKYEDVLFKLDMSVTY